MVAIYSDSKTGYHWLYSNKYACQYVDIPYRYNPWDYSVVFPCDLHNYGKIEWVSWNQTPYPYEFESNTLLYLFQIANNKAMNSNSSLYY